MIKYTLPSLNKYSMQKIPSYIYAIKKENIESTLSPNGYATIKFKDEQRGADPEFTNFLKIQKRKDGSEYVNWGGSRINLDTKPQKIEITNSWVLEID